MRRITPTYVSFAGQKTTGGNGLVLPIRGPGLNAERNFNVADFLADGVSTSVAAEMSKYHNWVRVFPFMTTEFGHGTRTAPVWPADPLANANFARFVTSIDRYIAAGLVVWYCFSPGHYSNNDFTQDPTVLDPGAYAAYLTAGAAWFAARYSPSQFVMSPWNETFNGNATTVNGLISSTYADLRAGAPNHWLGFCGPAFGRIWNMADLIPPAGATRFFYDTHDYEIVPNADFAFSNRANFYNAQEARWLEDYGLQIPIVIGEMSPVRQAPGFPSYALDDPQRITETQAFIAAVNRPVGLWAFNTNNAFRLNNPPNATTARWWPQLENVYAPGTHTIAVSPPAGGTFPLPHTLTITCTYTGNPSAIRVRVANGSWQVLDAAPANGTASGTVQIVSPGNNIPIDVDFANAANVTASTAVSITAQVQAESLTVSASPGGTGVVNYVGTYSPLSPTPSIRVYAVQNGADVNGADSPDSTSGGVFAGSIGSVPAGATTLRAEIPTGPITTTAAFDVVDDQTAPTVASITPLPARNYKTTDRLDVFVRMTEPVTVVEGSETPFINATIGANTRKMVFLSGPTASDLTFRYEIQASDSDADGVVIDTTVQLAGGTFRDAAGNDADFSALAWGDLSGVVVNQPEVSFSALQSVYEQSQSVVVSGVVFPADEPIEVVWRQGGSDVGSAVAATETGLTWTATITAPAVNGTYTLRARHVGAPAVFVDSANISIVAAGDSNLALTTGRHDHRADFPQQVTNANSFVSNWTSGQSLLGTFANAVIANQPTHIQADNLVSFAGSTGTGDTANGKWLTMNSTVPNIYAANTSALGVVYMLVRFPTLPTWTTALWRVSANNNFFVNQYRRGYWLICTPSSLSMIRGISTTNQTAALGSRPAAGEWVAIAGVLNDDRVTPGTSDNISRIFAKTKSGGTYATMATANSPVLAQDLTTWSAVEGEINRTRRGGSTPTIDLIGNFDVHSVAFDSAPPTTNGGIEAALNKLLERV
jgi:hypothetical protein